MLTITQTLDTFLNLIRGKEEGGPFSRFKSWEYCHLKFKEYKGFNRVLNDDEVDFLALHLSFYLASWGMYRGSSFILQRDYKTHRKIVRVVFQNKYDELWDYNPSNDNTTRMREIAELAKQAYDEIDQAYRDEQNKIPERCFVDENGDINKPVSITLITKILMGTFAVTPAYDRYFIDGAKCFKNNNPYFEEDGSRETFNGSYGSDKKFSSSLVKLFIFAKKHREELNTADDTTSFNYPIMKKVDMYFWEVGYEYGFYSLLNKKRNESDGKLDENGNIKDTKSQKSFQKNIGQISILFPYEVDDETSDLEKMNHLIPFFGSRF